MTARSVHHSFIGLHLTLGLVLLVESARTLVHTMTEHSGNLHLGFLSGTETIAALLFLWPRTLRIGGSVLIAILLVAAGAHAVRGELPGTLLVYAAAVLFVTIHGWPARAGAKVL